MGMTLGQIIVEIKERYPPAEALGDESIVRKINNLQAELFRTLYKPIILTIMDVFEGVYDYPLDFSPTKITGVIIDGIEIFERNAKGSDVVQSQFYYFTENSLCIYPTPKDDIDDGLSVFRYKEPYVLSTNDVGKQPDFDPDFHMMLVYGVCATIAEINRGDNGMQEAFVLSYNALEQKFLQAKEKAEYHVIQDVWGVLT